MKALTSVNRKMKVSGRKPSGQPLSELQLSFVAWIMAHEGDIRLPWFDSSARRYDLLIDDEGSLFIRFMRRNPLGIGAKNITLTYPMR